MRLNSSALNTRSLNGAARTSVYAAADVVAGFSAELTGRRTVGFFGTAISTTGAEFLAHAQRFASGEFQIVLVSDLAQTVARSGDGSAVFGITSDLFYTRKVYGFGSAEISLIASGDVGVVFIDGEAEIRPMTVDLDGAILRHGGGSVTMSLTGDLSSSAIRRTTLSAGPVEVSGTLEATHIHGGARYIGGYGAAEVAVLAKDAGMVRQTLIGSLDFDVTCVGSGRVMRPTLSGAATTTLDASGDFKVHKFFGGTATVVLDGGLGGDVYVRASGDAFVSLGASGTGYKTTHVTLPVVIANIHADATAIRTRRLDAAASLGMDASLSGNIYVRGDGTAVSALVASGAFRRQSFFAVSGALTAFETEMDAVVKVLGGADFIQEFGVDLSGIRTQHLVGDFVQDVAADFYGDVYVRGEGSAVMEVLGPSDGFVNIAADDDAEQTFFRPSVERYHAKPAIQRDWNRT